MGRLALQLWDVTGSTSRAVAVPPGISVDRLVALVVERTPLPRADENGRPVSYKLFHKGQSRALPGDQTLDYAQVHSRDAVLLLAQCCAAADVNAASAAGGNPWQAPEAPNEMKNCRFCGARIMAVARKCRYCLEYLDPDLRDDSEAGTGIAMLLPVNRPLSAVAAGYLGLLSLLPFVGIFAVITSAFALWTLKRNPHLHGRGRAWFGLIMGTLTTLLYGSALILALIGAALGEPQRLVIRGGVHGDLVPVPSMWQKAQGA